VRAQQNSKKYEKKSEVQNATFFLHSVAGHSGRIFGGGFASGFPCENSSYRGTIVVIVSLYFACENVSVGAISVSEQQAGLVDVFEVEAVLASAHVVRLSRFPLDVIGDGPGRRTGAAPSPGASALVLGAACPVVVVARPVAALGQVGQTLLLGRTVQSQRRHA
jgi:hypothetical protein